MLTKRKKVRRTTIEMLTLCTYAMEFGSDLDWNLTQQVRLTIKFPLYLVFVGWVLY